MNGARLYGKGIAFPPKVGADGRVAWSEGETNVRESIRIILMTEARERIRLADFGGGLNQFLFEPNTVTTRHQIEEQITRELAKWEPRIRVVSVDVVADERDTQTVIATIHYRLIATQVQERVSLSISLRGE